MARCGLYVCFLLSLPALSTGQRLGCKAPYNTIQLTEGEAGKAVTCTQTGSTQTVRWLFNGGVVATCFAPSNCSTRAPQFVRATRDSSSSTLTFLPAATRTNFGNNNTVTCRLLTDPEQDSNCTTEVKYPAETSSCRVEAETEGGDYSLRGSCVVSKVFSSLGLYACRWFHYNPNGQTNQIPARDTTMTSAVEIAGTASKPYYTFNCSFEVTLPQDAGRHNYTVTVTPGDVPTSTSYNIVLPTLQHNCPTDFLKAGDSLTCTCSTVTAGSLPAVVSWDNTNSNRLSLNMTSQDNNRRFTCQARWGTRVVGSTSFTLKVASGPGSVTVTGPQKPLDTNGQTSFTLTCDPSASIPSTPSFTWRRLPATSVIGRQRTITLPASRDLDEKEIQCTASNTQFSEISATGTYTVSLNYPPTSAPVIGQYQTGDVLYAGDPLTLTCTVTGGKPVANTSVIFSCPDGQQDGSDVISGDDVTSSLPFTPLQASNHGLFCECTARWKNTDWYTQRRHVNLTVYSSPSNPHINTPSTGYPFIAGVTRSARVTCVSDTRGVPPVTYTWIDTAGGRAGSDGSLTFDTVTPDLHNRTVSCRASNNFTLHKNRPLDVASRQIHVYYHPVIHISSSLSSCNNMSNGTHCDVMEHDNVTITCNSRSNPEPRSTQWYRGVPGGSPVSPTPLLRVTSADHVTDNGEYSCQSTTEDLAYSHPPLTSTHRLLLFVLYSPSQVNVTLNNDNAALTVREGDHVTVTCAANGRPTPRLQLYNQTGQEQPLESSKGGDKLLEDRVTSLRHVISSAQCSHTATYLCTANNNVNKGEPKEEAVQLFVLCKPRKDFDHNLDPVNYVGSPVQVSVKLVAYPLPNNATFVFRGPAGNLSKTVTEGKLRSRCWNTTSKYKVTCNITISNMTQKDEGEYLASISNGVGSVEIKLTVRYNETRASPVSGDKGVSPIVIGAVVAAVAFAVVVLLVASVLIRKRRRKQEGSREQFPRSRKNGGEVRGNKGSDDEVTIVNDIYDRTGNSDEDVTIINDIYEGAGNIQAGQQRNAAVRGDYEDVDVTSAKPKVHPKPVVGGKPTKNSGGDIYAVVNKPAQSQKSLSTNPDSSLYAIVDKGHKSSVHQQPAASGESEQKASKTTNVKQSKPKKDKPKQKPGKEMGARNEGKDAVYGNTPLSMRPSENTVYENYAFQKDETETSRDQALGQVLDGSDDNSTKNPDGLLYTTIAFTEEQRRKADHPPPGRETTEYAGIDFTRSAPSVANK